MSKIFLILIIGFATTVSFQNCAKLKSDQETPSYVLSSQTTLGDNSSVEGAEYFNSGSMNKASSVQINTSIIDSAIKTKLKINFQKDQIAIDRYELSNGGYESRIYETKTCKLGSNSLFAYLKNEFKKSKICTYVSTLKIEDFNPDRCMVVAPMMANSLANLEFHVNVQNVATLYMSENGAFNNYQRDPYCQLKYTTYCNADDDAGRLKPVIDDILSSIETSDVNCTITNPVNI